MKIYTVGGAVRDRLLGLPPGDRDYVVVGASPADMLAAGYTPVGKDFPVFLHPTTHEEYALARTERKSGHGYHGFAVYAAPDVTLEEDLARRDLTINAIAEEKDGTLIDPYGGQQDLQAKILRHVSPAFAEDPVRILRLARFAARFPQFSVAPETRALMQQMVRAGETKHLVAERVWQEVSRGFMAEQPARMLAELEACGATADIFPDVPAGPDSANHLNEAARRSLPLPVRVAVWLGEGSPEQVAALADRLRLPSECRDLALLLVRHRAALLSPDSLSAEDQLDTLERCDALRRPERFQTLLTALPIVGAKAGVAEQWQKVQSAAAAVDAGAIALAVRTQEHIASRIREARIEALQHLV